MEDLFSLTLYFPKEGIKELSLPTWWVSIQVELKAKTVVVLTADGQGALMGDANAALKSKMKFLLSW